MFFVIGPMVFGGVTYALLGEVQQMEFSQLFQSGWFIEGLLSQTLIVHMIRTRKVPFIQSRAALPVMLATFTIMGIGILLPFTNLGSKIGLVPLPLAYFPWLIATLLCYCVLTQVIKQWYIKRFSSWL
jgi:Mg2+-importing ATPase